MIDPTGDKSSLRCVVSPQQQLPPDSECSLERPPDLHGHDPGYPYVHGSSLRGAEQLLRECLQLGTDSIQGQGGPVWLHQQSPQTNSS